jgi:RNA polymerase sigma factor (sigma-70 family)
MSPSDLSAELAPSAAWRFASTHWSVVLAAGGGPTSGAQQALATLCRVYWYPLYAYARRRLANVDDAQELTQEFFSQFLEKNYVQAADPERGKFRTFLLTAFQRFLSKQQERVKAQKRGGSRGFVPLDFQAGERRYSLEPADPDTPESIFERRWALTLLEQTLARLRQEMAAAGKETLFERLKGTLTGDDSQEPYARIGGELGMTEQAVKVAVHRLRRRYQELLRAQIAQTVDRAEDVDDELRDLFAAVRRRSSVITH